MLRRIILLRYDMPSYAKPAEANRPTRTKYPGYNGAEYQGAERKWTNVQNPQ